MFKFLLPLVAAFRVPLRPDQDGLAAGYDVARAYVGCKGELMRQAQQGAAQKVRSQAAAETQPVHEQS